MADVDKSFAAITWGIDTSEYGLPSNHPSPIGYVPWVGYKTGERVRRYALVPCCRRGCGFMVHVDVDDPDFVPPANWIVGAWGAGDMPPPSWWGRQFVCGEGMGSLPSVPCHLIHGSVIDEVEQAGIRWTVWHRRGRHAGTVLWYAPHTRMYGTLSYTDEKDFFSAEALRDAIRWGSLGELYLWLSLRGGGYDEVVEEIARHVKATS